MIHLGALDDLGPDHASTGGTNVSQGSGPQTTGVAALKDGLDPQCMITPCHPHSFSWGKRLDVEKHWFPVRKMSPSTWDRRTHALAAPVPPQNSGPQAEIQRTPDAGLAKR